MNRLYVLGFLAFVSLSGCAAFWEGANGNRSAKLPCNPPGGVQDALLYPAPGSTGIPDNIGEVIFATSSVNGLFFYNAHLSDDTSGGRLQVDFAPFEAWGPAIPQPAATPSFSSAGSFASMNAGVGTTAAGSGATFPQGHTIRVQLKHGTCTPVDFGTFTVQ